MEFTQHAWISFLYSLCEGFRPMQRSFMRKGGGPVMMAAPMAMTSQNSVVPEKMNLKPVTSVRKLFPETWLWRTKLASYVLNGLYTEAVWCCNTCYVWGIGCNPCMNLWFRHYFGIIRSFSVFCILLSVRDWLQPNLDLHMVSII